MNRIIFPEKGSKYKNIRLEMDGIMFDSKGEMNRYVALKIKQQAGLIQGLRHQVPYKLVVNGQLICTYIADFVYNEAGKTVVEDFKGMLTDVFKLKMKLMKAVHGIDILLTRKPTVYSDIGQRKPRKKISKENNIK